ncbi:MAG: cation:proton antiporter, partial [Nocardioidaceae bacterium]
VVGWVRKRLVDPVFDTSISLVTPFLAYLGAESVNASGVLGVVIAGLFLGHKAPLIQTASSRISEAINWRTISFLLENCVFLLIGLQARWIIDDVANGGVSWGRVVFVCLAVLLGVVVLRLVWVFLARYLLVHSGPDPEGPRLPPWRYTFLLGWAGMRGVVTLAAAFAIPTSFPHREVLILAALVVTAGTLFGQGTTLPWLVRRLGVVRPDPRQDALARAALFEKATAAGLAKLAEYADEDDPHNTVEALRRRAEQRDFAAWERLGATDPDEETPSETYARLRLEMLGAERARVLEVRDTGKVAHEIIEDVLNTLDVEESMLDTRSARREAFVESTRDAVVAPRKVPACEHLRTAEDLPRDTEGVCEDCSAIGQRNWVHLRQCLTCGHVACCDSSPYRHATAHYGANGHPVMRSAEAGEDWRWCFVDNRLG